MSAPTDLGGLVVDPMVKRALAQWAEERDSDVGRGRLARAMGRMGPGQKRQLLLRLATISLALLHVSVPQGDTGADVGAEELG